jgi:hypothetical protein
MHIAMQHGVMHPSDKLPVRGMLSLVLALLFPVILAAHTQTGPPSKDSSANPAKQRLEQILHFG